MTIPLSFPTVGSFTSVINQLLPEPHAGLLAGISFGIKATLSKNLTNDLIKTGTLHIVALSGMNISIVASLVSLTLLRFISRRTTSLLTIGMILSFVWFVGISPSAIRAAIMGSLSLLAVILGRANWPIFTWILAVSSMLLLNPLWIGDLSFQLSALATLGIILFGGQKNAHVTYRQGSFGWLKNFLTDDLRVTLAAQVFTIPIILANFHRISLVSPLSNVLIGWTIGPLTVAGWMVAVLGTIWLPLGQVVAWVVWVPLQYLLTIVSWTAQIPFASFGW